MYVQKMPPDFPEAFSKGRFRLGGRNDNCGTN